MPQLVQRAIGEIEQIDFAGGTERDVGPSTIGISCRRALMHTHFVDRDIDGVEAASRRIGHRHTERAGVTHAARSAVTTITATAAAGSQ